jgi:hypothetical protein
MSELGYNVIYCIVMKSSCMGMVVTIYLSDEEAQGLKDFCKRIETRVLLTRTHSPTVSISIIVGSTSFENERIK